MHTHLKEDQYYEDLYDKITVEFARRNIVYFDKFYAEFEAKLPSGEEIDRPGNAFVINVFYMETVGNELLKRYNERDQKIAEWRERDAAKDAHVADTRLTEEPRCRHCGAQGLRITDKDLMNRSQAASLSDNEEVLFTLRCPGCDKYTACWGDGELWLPKPTLCVSCGSEMTQKTTKTKAAIIFQYSCAACGNAYNDKIDLKDKNAKTDPEYANDRDHFCLRNDEFRNRLASMRRDFLGMAQLGKEMQEKRDNRHIYDAIKEMKKPKIAELSGILTPALAKAGFIEVTLDKPEIGKDVIVGFSCLDNQSGRSDHDSEKQLKQAVNRALENTNWRLMSDGIHYRLGYMSGRIKAYEDEEALKNLVARTAKKTKS
ncbi:MAG TPA: hypothetical protein VHB51_02520 [Candidatus Saccharimonadales bacterium]|nr:hypothetical protein [Candidatus Saccharimonadales bacterium]